jgi:hypothetical protein
MDLDVVPQRHTTLSRYRVRLVVVRAQQLALTKRDVTFLTAGGHD